MKTATLNVPEHLIDDVIHALTLQVSETYKEHYWNEQGWNGTAACADKAWQRRQDLWALRDAFKAQTGRE